MYMLSHTKTLIKMLNDGFLRRMRFEGDLPLFLYYLNCSQYVNMTLEIKIKDYVKKPIYHVTLSPPTAPGGFQSSNLTSQTPNEEQRKLLVDQFLLIYFINSASNFIFMT